MNTQEQVSDGGGAAVAAAAAAADQVQDGEPRDALTAVLTSKALEVAHNGFAGATAGAVSRVLTAPLDVAKIRFQLDHGATRRYDSTLWAAMRSIYGEEGLVTLWRGNLPAMFLWSAYTAVQFSAYEQLRATDFLLSRQHDSVSGGGVRHRSSSCSSSSPPYERRGAGRVGEVRGRRTGGREDEKQYEVLRRQQDGRGRGLPPALANFVYGAMAAFTATLVTYPLDITRTALAFQGVPKRYDSMSEFLRRTARESGVRGLFRGATPTLAMITPQMGVSFAVWEGLKGGAPPAFSGSGSGASPAATLSWQLGAGMVAGMVGKLVVFPLDTVKKRVQTAVMMERNSAYGVLPKYAGPVHALKTVLREEGAAALFRGTVPAMWKTGVSTAVTYAVYEWVRAGTAVALE